MIEVEGLTKVYRDGTVALDHVTFQSKAKVLSVLGRNGAGKTTMMRILSTQLLPSSGKARILGLDVVSEAERLRDLIVSIPQEAKPVGFASPLEHLTMFLTARGESIKSALEESRRALKEIGLWEVRDKPCDDLSGGMKRKVFVAMALASNAELIFLDEPTTGLDPISRLEVWSVIKNISSRVVLTTHYMEEAEELSQDIVMLGRGKVIAKGTKEELLAPLRGKVRVEGIGDRLIGKTQISYMDENRAREIVGKAVIKPVSLEDLFILHGEDGN
ncbi:putative ABC transporter ATP-binding protein [Metallosphaera sp. J1]|uniref:ABC transporter ATP-binding protein n=1 Tax=Metallosphaera TaxID=41980 RepID=UPI001EE10207|nr:ABC transporter ATP-binding protein [Metallosphaera javensis (ex Hofmann et al. 2022)]MCG3109837.1 putative ABC transporter ATP-binding protein [Metallosphaera javensis (ex Hofmann et al. 2022)]BCS92410.1 MAG: multidrug ABC transporter ATP-binding protein [Metallosphaera javensis (ex Sakai et al. 2022)]